MSEWVNRAKWGTGMVHTMEIINAWKGVEGGGETIKKGCALGVGEA